MSLLAALKLPPAPAALVGRANALPAPPAQAKGTVDPALDPLRAEVAADVKAAVQVAAGIADHDRRQTLAAALAIADKQRAAAERMTDPAGRKEALLDAQRRVRESVAAAKAAEQKDLAAAKAAEDEQRRTGAAQAARSAVAAARSGQREQDDAAVAGEREEVASKMHVATQVAAGITDATRKRTLVEALGMAEKQRLDADRMTDPAAKREALQQVQARIQAALKQAGANGGETLRVEVAALAPKLAADKKAAQEAARAAQADADAADDTAKAAPRADKAAVEMRKAAADKRLSAAQARLKQIDADLAALDSSATSPDALHAILARQKAAGRAISSDVSRDQGSGLRGAGEVRTASVASGGASRTTTTTTTSTYGKLDRTDKSERVTTEIDGDHKTTRTDSRTTTLGLDLAPSTEKTEKVEHEHDGKTAGVEKKTTTGASVAAGTATHTSSTTVTRTNGSSTETTTSGGLERADGKLGGTGTLARTQTDEKGNEAKTSGTGKGGMIAGKDGVGAFGGLEAGRDTKTPGGMKTGLVGGLNGNIVCNIVKDEKANPPMYDLTVTIDLGVSVGRSVAHDKEPEKGKPDENTRMTAKVSGGISGKVTMVRTHHLGEAQAQAYVEALKTGNGTDAEFAIIKVGLGKSWDDARNVYLGLSNNTASKASEDSLEKGGSLKTAKELKSTGGIDIGTKGGAIGGGISLSGEHTQDGSITLSKDNDGNVTYDAKQGDAKKGTVGARVNAGGVEGSFAAGRTWTTSTGYKLAIPKDASPADAEAMRKALNACNSQADLDAFAKRFPKAVQETTRARGQNDTQEVGVGLGSAAKASMKFGSGVDEETTTDKDGKLKGRKTTGSNEGGMDVTILGRKLTASSKQQAVSTTDAQGQSHTDVTQTDTSTDMTKLLGAMPGSGGGEGALAKATGGSDTEQKDLQGLGLDDAALGRLGMMACDNWKGWMDCAVNADDRIGWATAGRRIQKANGATKVVAAELAKFVGRSGGNPRLVVHDAVRGKKGIGGGDGWEFTGELAKLKPAYDETVVAESEQTVQALFKEPEKAKAQGDALLATLAKLQGAVDSEPNFQSPALRGEMLAAIASRSSKVRIALRNVLKGGPPDANDDLQEHKARYNELLRNCATHQQDEKKLFEQVQENLESAFGGNTAAANVKPVTELQALYEVWDAEYEEFATLAQTYKLGSGNYWSFRPDRERYQLAHDNKKPFGERKKGASRQEDDQRHASLLKPDEKNRVPDPNAKSIDEIRKERQQADEERIRNGTRIQNELPGARTVAEKRGTMLLGFLDQADRPAAVKAFDDGQKLFSEAEALAARVHKDHMPELVDLGAKALDKYKAALALFNKGLAAFPKDWSK